MIETAKCGVIHSHQAAQKRATQNGDCRQRAGPHATPRV
jgi:hypothetical protein